MKTKEEYYKLVLKNRETVKNPDNIKCPCPNSKCEWHGKCRECVAIHRYYKDHLPNCFKPFVNEKIKLIAAIGELDVIEKEKTPDEYRDYVKERDRKLLEEK